MCPLKYITSHFDVSVKIYKYHWSVALTYVSVDVLTDRYPFKNLTRLALLCQLSRSSIALYIYPLRYLTGCSDISVEMDPERRHAEVDHRRSLQLNQHLPTSTQLSSHCPHVLRCPQKKKTGRTLQ